VCRRCLGLHTDRTPKANAATFLALRAGVGIGANLTTGSLNTKLTIGALIVVVAFVRVATTTLLDATAIDTGLALIALTILGAIDRTAAVIGDTATIFTAQSVATLCIAAAALTFATTILTLAALADLASSTIISATTPLTTTVVIDALVVLADLTAAAIAVVATTFLLDASTAFASLTLFTIFSTTAAAWWRLRDAAVITALKSIAAVFISTAFAADILAKATPASTDLALPAIAVIFTTLRTAATRDTPHIVLAPQTFGAFLAVGTSWRTADTELLITDHPVFLAIPVILTGINSTGTAHVLNASKALLAFVIAATAICGVIDAKKH
jgi:hypothetical protein